MELAIRPSATAPIAYKGDGDRNLGQRVVDNSTGLTVGGGAGLATFGTISQSSKIGNGFVKAIKGSKAIKVQKQAQILELLAKCKPLAKFANNPLVIKGAGILAGASALTTLAGSTAKIVDTYGYLSNQNVA
ncbi:MAG: hypothetical protein K6E29_08770 [Cyanobacteria bacterium RUI128]|nr:hypothetical protein [Cyanobacteria bacterium RUI128]